MTSAPDCRGCRKERSEGRVRDGGGDSIPPTGGVRDALPHQAGHLGRVPVLRRMVLREGGEPLGDQLCWFPSKRPVWDDGEDRWPVPACDAATVGAGEDPRCPVLNPQPKASMEATVWLNLKVQVSGYRDRETGEIVVSSVTLEGNGREFRGKELELDDDQLADVRREIADAIQGDV